MVYLGVIGAGECDSTIWDLAYQVGEEIARHGAIMICGGLGGVMEAAAAGCRAAGGMCIGILPGPDRVGANRFLTASIVTGMGEARNAIVVRSSEAVIAIAGGYGTLSEIGLALKAGIPVVGLETWGLSRNGRPESSIRVATSSAQDVEMVWTLAGKH
ncbi:MAG: TIGR00725 family protein [Clostridia bacterium]|nr:MAG: TIGR00725 family protein [Clostridia bacterium]